MKIFQMVFLTINFLCFFAALSSPAQTILPKTPDEKQREAEQRQREAIEKRDKFFKQMDITKTPDRIRRKNSPEQQAVERDSKKYAKQLEEMQIAPPAYHEKFAALLASDKKMNLVRIFTDKGCDILNDKVISVENSERCANVVPVAGGGAYYSFKEKSNFFFYGYGPDIYFIEDKFVTGSGLTKGSGFSEGIISEIGDVALETLGLDSEPFKFLVENSTRKNFIEFKSFGVKLRMGIDSGGFHYSNAAPFKLNSAYVIRSITYKPFFDLNSKGRGTVSIKGTSKDIFVAFKAVGQESDGSVILLWKQLKN